jgi:hypothetical protein
MVSRFRYLLSSSLSIHRSDTWLAGRNQVHPSVQRRFWSAWGTSVDQPRMAPTVFGLIVNPLLFWFVFYFLFCFFFSLYLFLFWFLPSITPNGRLFLFPLKSREIYVVFTSSWYSILPAEFKLNVCVAALCIFKRSVVRIYSSIYNQAVRHAAYWRQYEFWMEVGARTSQCSRLDSHSIELKNDLQW